MVVWVLKIKCKMPARSSDSYLWSHQGFRLGQGRRIKVWCRPRKTDKKQITIRFYRNLMIVGGYSRVSCLSGALSRTWPAFGHNFTYLTYCFIFSSSSHNYFYRSTQTFTLLYVWPTILSSVLGANNQVCFQGALILSLALPLILKAPATIVKQYP